MQQLDIRTLVATGENISLECKRAEGGLPKSIWETYSAFANTNGGTILLGIEEVRMESGKRLLVHGVKDAEKLKKEFWDTINSDKTSSNILMDRDVREAEVEGKTILIIQVPRAESRQRPVYINGNVTKGTYRRNYEGDYHCTESEIRAMLRDSDDGGSDGVLIEHYTMDDIDRNTLQAYRQRFRVFNEDHVWNDADDRQFLINMGGYTIRRETGAEGLTLAGLLMFGTGLAIRERFDNFRIDYLDLTNLLPGSRWSDRLTYDGRWENNLYNFYTRVQAKLTADIKRPFHMEGMTRIDDTPVHKAVREALTNAIIHADYFVTGGVLRIEKRDNSLFFSNPGSLKVSIDELYQGHISKARNPRIQNMMRMVGMGENIGSGFPTIVKAWADAQWQRPIVEENLRQQFVNLTLYLNSLSALETTLTEGKTALTNEGKTTLTDEEKTTQTDKQKTTQTKKPTSPVDNKDNSHTNGGKNTQTNEQKITLTNTRKTTLTDEQKTALTNRKEIALTDISETQLLILKFLRKHPDATKLMLMRAIPNATDHRVKYDLKALQEKGYLKRVGPRFGGHWEVITMQSQK